MDIQTSISHRVLESFRLGFGMHRSITNTAQRRWIGLENEYPMVCEDGTPIQLSALNQLWDELRKAGWEISVDKVTNHAVEARRETVSDNTDKAYHFDSITTDFGYPTLEISLSPSQTVLEAEHKLREILELVVDVLAKFNTTIIGYGVQPLAEPSPKFLAPKERYSLVADIYDYESQHNSNRLISLYAHCLSASSQTHVEVASEEAIDVVNCLNMLSGLRIALLANSNLWTGKSQDYLALRELFWEWSWPTRKHQVGIPEPFMTFEDYIDRILHFSALMVRRDDAYYRLPNSLTLNEYLEMPSITISSLLGRDIEIIPDINDFWAHSSFAWYTARLRPEFGTVEDRVSCQQLPSSHMCASALTLGLVENYKEALLLCHKLPLSSWRSLRLDACRVAQDAICEEANVSELIHEMLLIAARGLEVRGYGEERYLDPLFTRLALHQCPAQEVARNINKDNIDKLLNFTNMKHFVTNAHRS